MPRCAVCCRYARHGHVLCHVSGELVPAADGRAARPPSGSCRRRHVTPSLRHDDGGRSGSRRVGWRYTVLGGDSTVHGRRTTLSSTSGHVRAADERPESAVTPRRRSSSRWDDARRHGCSCCRTHTGHPRRVISVIRLTETQPAVLTV